MVDFKIITGCDCGDNHMLLRDEAERVLARAERADPVEVTGRNGVRVTVSPLTVALHDPSLGEPSQD